MHINIINKQLDQKTQDRQKMYNEPEQDVCFICSYLFLKPALLPCKHEFCCFCIQSIKYQNQEDKIVCPLCRRLSEHAPLNQERQISVIERLMKQKADIRVFWAFASTLNDYDGNLTKSRPFFYILDADVLKGDVIWGGGTQHDSYEDEVCRVSGKVKVYPQSIILDQKYSAKYSNTPEQQWSGTFKLKQNGVYELENGRYIWNGWGRVTSGTLNMQLKQIKSVEELNKYRSINRRG